MTELAGRTKSPVGRKIPPGWTLRGGLEAQNRPAGAGGRGGGEFPAGWGVGGVIGGPERAGGAGGGVLGVGAPVDEDVGVGVEDPAVDVDGAGGVDFGQAGGGDGGGGADREGSGAGGPDG